MRPHHRGLNLRLLKVMTREVDVVDVDTCVCLSVCLSWRGLDKQASAETGRACHVFVSDMFSFVLFP